MLLLTISVPPIILKDIVVPLVASKAFMLFKIGVGFDK